MASPQPRPAIPEDVKRTVRQRCAFGCVLCGIPLYTYEHMLGWANVQRHLAEEITLLCDRHQRERTNNLLTATQVQEANRDPYNLRTGVSRPYDLHFAGPHCSIGIAGNEFVATDAGTGLVVLPLVIDGHPIVMFEGLDGHLLLSLTVADESNFHVLVIDRNELVYKVDPWDVEFVGRRLIVREGPGQILIEIEFQPPNRISLTRGRVLCDGVEVILGDSLVINGAGVTFQGNIFFQSGPMAGIVIGPNAPAIPTFWRVPRINRYPKRAAR